MALRYEASLRYYVLGLKSAGSAYAFHSIGSSIAVSADAYAAVRGFPRRAAAEDFYLLNKLAKVGKLEPQAGAPIELSGRVSPRVPFGTGRAVGDHLEGRKRISAYHPTVFRYLGAWLRSLDTFAGAAGETPLTECLEQGCAGDPEVDPERLHSILLSEGDWEAAETAGKRRRAGATLAKHLRDTFDGFRTRKLIHTLRDRHFASRSLESAVEEAVFTGHSAPRQLAELCEHLERLERRREVPGQPLGKEPLCREA